MTGSQVTESPQRVYLSLGSNLGNRIDQIESALQLLRASPLIELTERSSLYETEPQDIFDQPWFYNMAVGGLSGAEPRMLLDELQRIEQTGGRFRDEEQIGRGPRLIDIDILLYGSLVLTSPGLTIPHPRMLARRFVLEPLCEINPGLVDPVSGRLLSSYLPVLEGQRVTRVAG